MQSTIRLIDGILLENNDAYSPNLPITPHDDRLVRVILADWNYGNAQVEKHGGFRWAAKEWWKLLQIDSTHQLWNACFLGFDVKDVIQDETEIGRMVLTHDGVKYLQINKISGQEIKDAITDLSSRLPSRFSDDMVRWLNKMSFCKDAANWLHSLKNSLAYFKDNSNNFDYIQGDLVYFENNIKKVYSNSLTDRLLPIVQKLNMYMKAPNEELLGDLRGNCKSLSLQINQERIQ